MRNYSQEYLASMIGISQPAYAKMEQGKTKITLEKLRKISETLQVEQRHLLDGIKIDIEILQVGKESQCHFMEVLQKDLKKLYEKFVKILESENQRLLKENERLRKLLEQKET